MTASMMIHRGGRLVSRSLLANVDTPTPTETWHPIPHHQLLEEVEGALARNNLRIISAEHAIAVEGQRYFGLLQIANGHKESDHGWVLGLRNSHDQTFPAGFVVGSRVFICDNLAFSGEIVIARRHTRWIRRDLPRLVMSGVGQLTERWHSQTDRYGRYRLTEVSDPVAHDLLIRALDAQAITSQQVKDVLRQWREPSYPDFRARTAWSLFNAFTHVVGEGSIWTVSRRTQVLHGVLDTHCGLADPSTASGSLTAPTAAA